MSEIRYRYPATIGSFWLSAIAGAVLASVVPGLVQAQVLYGSLVGNVTDASGAGVPGATVKVTQTETNESREIQTSETGGYTLSTLAAGPYTLTVSKQGFRTFTTENIQVRLNTVVRVDAALQVGQINESVERSEEHTSELQSHS